MREFLSPRGLLKFAKSSHPLRQAVDKVVSSATTKDGDAPKKKPQGTSTRRTTLLTAGSAIGQDTRRKTLLGAS